MFMTEFSIAFSKAFHFFKEDGVVSGYITAEYRHSYKHCMSMKAVFTNGSEKKMQRF
jgi:hypothetical protein